MRTCNSSFGSVSSYYKTHWVHISCFPVLPAVTNHVNANVGQLANQNAPPGHELHPSRRNGSRKNFANDRISDLLEGEIACVDLMRASLRVSVFASK